MPVLEGVAIINQQAQICAEAWISEITPQRTVGPIACYRLFVENCLPSFKDFYRRNARSRYSIGMTNRNRTLILLYFNHLNVLIATSLCDSNMVKVINGLWILVIYLQSSLLLVILTWLQGGVFTVCSIGLLVLSVFSCGRYFLVGSLDVCYSSFYLFLLFSFALEYLLLISMEMALILLSRSCFVAAFCCSSAWEFK